MTPTGESDLLKSEALRRASCLSSMDQFYAGLEEQRKQLQMQLDQRESEFARTYGFQQEQFDYEKERARRGDVLEKHLLGQEQERYEREQGFGELMARQKIVFNTQFHELSHHNCRRRIFPFSGLGVRDGLVRSPVAHLFVISSKRS